MDSSKKIAEFKTQAWASRASAARYARQVNRDRGIENIYLEVQVSTLRKLTGSGSKVADIGSGTGALSLRLSKLGFVVTAIDISKEMLDELRKRDKSRRIETIEANIFDLQAEGDFDGAVSRWVLPHFQDWYRVLPEVGKLLKSGGVFVFDFPNKEHVDYVRTKELMHPDKIGYDHWAENDFDPYSYYNSADASELIRALDDAGFSMEARVPFGLVRANSLLAESSLFSKSRFQTWFWKLALRLKIVQDLFRAIEANITPNLPINLVHSSFVVARKR